MPSNNLTPDFFKAGEPLKGLRPKLNALVDLARAAVTGVNPPKRLEDRGIAAVPGVMRFQIVEILEDYLVCYPLTGNPDTDSTLTFVAKPPLLCNTQNVERGGITYAYVGVDMRVATNADAETEEQVVIPSYRVDDIITAISNITGGTGVVSGTAVQTEEDVIWADLNRDARAWGKTAVAFE